MSSDLLEKGYEPGDVEKRWYAYWEEKQMFAATKDEAAETGLFHRHPAAQRHRRAAHGPRAEQYAAGYLVPLPQDAGYNVLWMPGHRSCRHRHPKRGGTETGRRGHATGTRLGREKFIEAVWEWREEYGGIIINQLKRLGASCDWDRERFTMDEGLSRAVRKVFVSSVQ